MSTKHLPAVFPTTRCVACADFSKLWTWLQYYINNWRLNDAHTRAILAAITDSYWHGAIAWADFTQCRDLLNNQLASEASDSDIDAADLSLGLQSIGHKLKQHYQIFDIRAFVDQGILLSVRNRQSRDENDANYDVLRLTTDKEGTREVVKSIPQINQLELPFLIQVRSVLKEAGQVYLILSECRGIPLPVWLSTQHPTGLPKALAQHLLAQIYHMLQATQSQPYMAASIHPGQLLIDPDTLNLQLLPFATQAQRNPQAMRGSLYQAASLLPEQSFEACLGHQLMAIAYEIYTGCVPDFSDFQRMQAVMQSCSTLSQWQQRKLTRALVGDAIKPIGLKQAAQVFALEKKSRVIDAALVASVSIFALSAFIWQGVRYAPDIVAWFQGQPDQETIVIKQDVKDGHVNLLKAAFFTQTAQTNIAAAHTSWQALQQLLPADDIFIEKIGPEQLAQSYITTAERLMLTDPQASGVLTRAAARIAPELPRLNQLHLQSLSQMEIIDPPSATQMAQSIAEIEDGVISEEALNEAVSALAEALREPLPPLPNMDMESALYEVIAVSNAAVDPCLNAFMSQQTQSSVFCMDALTDDQFAPRLLAVPPKPMESLPVFMMETHVSVADYNQYCAITGFCATQHVAASSGAPEAALDFGFHDVQNTVYEYNTYCLLSGDCEPIGVPAEPAVGMTTAQISQYIQWLSEQTGFTYRLPTVSEWEHMVSSQQDNPIGVIYDETQLEWLQDENGQWVTTARLSGAQGAQDNESVTFRLVREVS